MLDMDDYGFFCDLENSKIMEYDEVDYYVVTMRTHYEVRRKLSFRPPIKGDPATKVSELGQTKSSIEDMTKITKNPECEKNGGIISFLKRLPRDIYYSLLICFTTTSCIYFVVSQPDYTIVQK